MKGRPKQRCSAPDSKEAEQRCFTDHWRYRREGLLGVRCWGRGSCGWFRVSLRLGLGGCGLSLLGLRLALGAVGHRRGRLVRKRRRSGCAAMIGAIESAALEHYPCGVDDALNVAGTLGANLDGIVGNLLPGLKAVAAGLATIIVCWHNKWYALLMT